MFSRQSHVCATGVLRAHGERVCGLRQKDDDTTRGAHAERAIYSLFWVLGPGSWVSYFPTREHKGGPAFPMSGVTDIQAAIDVLQAALAVLAAVADADRPGDEGKLAEMTAAAHEVRQEVESRMAWAAMWQPAMPSVRVSNGLGTFRGTERELSSASSRSRARRAAQLSRCSDTVLSSESEREEDIISRPSGAPRGSASNPHDTSDRPAERSSKWFPGLDAPREDKKPPPAPAPPARPVVGFRPSVSLVEPEGCGWCGSPGTTAPAACCPAADAAAPPGQAPAAAGISADAGLQPQSPEYVLDNIKALLIDLDGTMYNPSGAIPGADAFYAYLLRNRLPFVFLSNTGAKGPHGVQSKLMSRGFMLQAAPVPVSQIYTAAQAQCRYMIDHIPPGSRVFVIAGGAEDHGPEAHADRASIDGSWWMRLLLEGTCEQASWSGAGAAGSGADEPWSRGEESQSCQLGGCSCEVGQGGCCIRRPRSSGGGHSGVEVRPGIGRNGCGAPERGDGGVGSGCGGRGCGSSGGCGRDGSGAASAADLISSWEIRTHLSEEEAKEWSVIAAAHLEHPTVFVVLFSDGSITASVDPKTGQRGHADWSFHVIQKASYMLSHGAEFVCTAEDAFNPTKDGFPLPGPGMFSAMFRKLMYPLGRNRHRVCGKGGGPNEGGRYMVGHAIDMLRRQGFCGELNEIMIVGDRFDTDIRAGVSAGIRTCLVESGCHSHQLQAFYPIDRADFVAESVAELLPPASLPRRVSAGLDVATRPRTRKLSSEEPHRPSAADGSPRASLDSLRSWMLSRGNLVYASSKAPSLVPLVQRLRRYFDDQDPDATGYISATDTYLALKQLGIAPQQRTLPRAATVDGLLATHAQPTNKPPPTSAPHVHTSGMGSLSGVDEGGGSRFATVQVGALSRVTFRQFFREVQRGFELASLAPAALGSAAPAALVSPAARRSAAAALIYCKDAGASALRRLPLLTRAPSVPHALRRVPSAGGWADAPPPAMRDDGEACSSGKALPIEAEEEASLFGNPACESAPGGFSGPAADGTCRSVDDDAACGLDPTGESPPRRVRSGHCARSPFAAAAAAGSSAGWRDGGTGRILSSEDLFDMAEQHGSAMRRNAASLPRDLHLHGGAVAEEGAAWPRPASLEAPPPEPPHEPPPAPLAAVPPPHAKLDLHEVGLRRAHTEG